MSKNSRMMSYFSQAGIATWLSIYWCAAMLFRATALVLAIPVLAVYLIPDFLPKFGSSRSTSRTPQHPKQGTPARKLPIPLREGSDIFVLNPDGSKVALDALEAKVQAQAWFEVVSGAMVYAKVDEAPRTKNLAEHPTAQR